MHKLHFATETQIMDVGSFWVRVRHGYPNISQQAIHILVVFTANFDNNKFTTTGLFESAFFSYFEQKQTKIETGKYRAGTTAVPLRHSIRYQNNSYPHAGAPFL